MTTFTIQIPSHQTDITEAFKILLSNFQGISFEVETDETLEKNLSVLYADICYGDALEKSKPLQDIYSHL